MRFPFSFGTRRNIFLLKGRHRSGFRGQVQKRKQQQGSAVLRESHYKLMRGLEAGLRNAVSLLIDSLGVTSYRS